ncbi:MAG: hypothetical protein ACI9IA_000196 [Enterobacterales bacterium]|jgi:hypothetical protein
MKTDELIGKWISLVCDSRCLYTDFLDLGCVGYIRTYSWDENLDTGSCMAMARVGYEEMQVLRGLVLASQTVTKE